MLVLSRKQGERIYIGDHIEVNVVAVRGNRVKLAFAAPQDVPIRRAELLVPVMASPVSQDQPQLHAQPRVPR